MGKNDLEQQRAILLATADVLIVLDENGIVLDCSEATEHIFGLPSATLVGQRLPLYLPPLREIDDKRILHLEIDGPEPRKAVDCVLVPYVKNNRRHFILNIRTFDPNKDRADLLGGIATYRMLVESPLQGLAIIKQGHILHVNRALCFFFGRNPRDMYGRSLDDFLSEKSALQLKSASRALRPRIIQLTGIRPDGQSFYIEARLDRTTWDKKSVIQMSCLDVTSRVLIERHLLDSQSRLLDILNSIQSGIFVKDLTGHYLLANTAFCNLIGSEPSQIIGQRIPDITIDTNGDYLTSDDYVIETGQATGVHEYILDTDSPDSGSDELYCLINKFPLCDSHGKLYAICGILTDITDLRLTEKKLKFVEKLKILGQMSSTFIHDFNNYLAIIMGNLELGLASTSMDSRLRQNIDAAFFAAKKSAELSERLLSLVQNRQEDADYVNIRDVVINLRVLLQQSVGDQYPITITTPEIGWYAFIQVGQLEAALLNLVLNARAACLHDSNIQVVVENYRSVSSRKNKTADFAPGHFIRLCVIDNGQGMTDEVKRKALEPFFTTKAKGQGNGLGLAQVYRFVTESNGHLSIDSSPGKGTRVTISLPRVVGYKPKKETA